MPLKQYPGHKPKYGYACQTWLAREVNHFLHAGRYFCWFAGHFNAMANGDDSNPMWLYITLDRAVNQGAVNNAKIKDVRSNLMLAVQSELARLGRTGEVPRALRWIRTAPIAMFTPQVWKIDRDAIAKRLTGPHQYPDEYNIADLADQEFDIIID